MNYLKKLTLSFTLFSLSFFLTQFSMAQLSEVNSGIYVWENLPVRKGEMREGRRLMEGTESHFEYLEIHATTQQPGAKPAAPHTQQDIEEILYVKEGTMKMTMDGESRVLSAGSLVLIPPLVEQSLENVGQDQLTYYVFMFRSRKPMDLERGLKNGGFQFLEFKDLEVSQTAKGERISFLDHPTAMCRNLEIHSTRLNEMGPSHPPHSHEDTEVILVLEGKVQVTLDGQATEGKVNDLYLIKSGQTHGIANLQNTPCRYLAIRWR